MEIQQYTFGKIVIDGTSYTEDIKIIGERVVAHWFRSSGHWLAPGDLDDVLAARPRILVLGKGEPGRMSCSRELADLIAREKIELFERPTKEAVSIFNELYRQGKNVAAGFHLSC